MKNLAFFLKHAAKIERILKYWEIYQRIDSLIDSVRATSASARSESFELKQGGGITRIDVSVRRIGD